MKLDLQRVAPALFVFIWSTGFVVARYATEDAGPLTFLAIRLLGAAALLWLVVLAIRAPAITADQTWWSGVAGLGMQAMYLGGVFVAISLGLPTGLSALIAGIHPVVTSIGARWLLGERLRPIQWFGISLGVVGVVVVVAYKLTDNTSTVTTAALIAMGVSVFGMSGGTLVQRAHGVHTPLLRGTAVQFSAAGVALAIAAVFNEHWEFESTAQSWLAMAYALIGLSIAAVLIMMYLLQRQAAAQVSSLFFLTPALSTIEGAILFGESIGAIVVLGLLISLVGVWLTTRRSAPVPAAVVVDA